MKFGPGYAGRLKRKVPGCRDAWHPDEGVISIAGQKRNLPCTAWEIDAPRAVG